MQPDKNGGTPKQVSNPHSEVVVVTTAPSAEAEPLPEGTSITETYEQTLGRELSSLLTIVKESYQQKKAPPERLKKFSEFLGSIRTIVSSLLLIGLLILLTGVMYVEVSRKHVQIAAFDVPPDFNKEGYSSQVIASKLADRINDIKEKARARGEWLQFTPASYEMLPDVEVPETKTSLRSLVQYTKELFGYTPTQVGGEIIADSAGRYMTVRIIKNGSQGNISYQTVGGPGESVDQLVNKAAEYVVREIDPYVLTLYYYGTGKTDAALDLALYCVYNKSTCAYNKSTEENSWAYVVWGLILDERNQSEEAVASFQKAIEINPAATNAYIDWGLVLEKKKDYTEAVKKYQKALEIEPTAALAHNNWGNILLLQGDYEGALAKFKEAIKSDRTLGLPYRNWAAALVGRRDYKEAYDVYQMAIATNPKDAAAYRAWGWALQQQGDFTAAITKYQKAVEIEPLDPVVYNDWGYALHQLERYPEAVVKFQKAIEIDPANALAYNNWGFALQQMGNQKEAVLKFRKAVGINPRYASAYNNLGYSLENLKEYEQAAASYEKAIEYDSQSALAYFNLAYLQEHLKRYEQAISNYQQVLKRQSAGDLYDYATKTIPKLQQLSMRKPRSTLT